MSKTFEKRKAALDKYIAENEIIWDKISSNPNIPMETRGQDPNKPWDWEAILQNPPPMMKLLDQYPDIFWD